ncbi:hypothetical protein FOL47_005473 [Perkinsus chesapeaki]|uniref:Uncharacterized protein n=1 Tax=Perkinsus chesapeaki TaxID=330153 RepID=A0A7J6LXK1_PERCH|nr:hypothetical protein FOL47_005473 [Perkinsus chesapeaki]
MEGSPWPSVAAAPQQPSFPPPPSIGYPPSVAMAWGQPQPASEDLSQPHMSNGTVFDTAASQHLQPSTTPQFDGQQHYNTTGSLADPYSAPPAQLPATAPVVSNPLEEKREAALMCIGKCLYAPEKELGMPPPVYGACVRPAGFSPLTGEFVEPSATSRRLSNASALTEVPAVQRKASASSALPVAPSPRAALQPQVASTTTQGGVGGLAPQLEQMQEQLDMMTRQMQSLLLTRSQAQVPQMPPSSMPQQYPTYAASPYYPPQPTGNRSNSVATLPQQQPRSPYPVTDRPAPKSSLLDIEENERKMRELDFKLKRLQKDIRNTRLGR